MSTTEVAFALNTVAPVVITRQSFIGIDQYETVLEIPANRFTTGHDYVFVFCGTYGQQGGNGSSIPELMPYLGNFPFGSFLTNQRVSGLAIGSNGIDPFGRVVSLPYYSIYRNTSWPASTKLSIFATNRNSTGTPNFKAEAAALVFDLTNLNAESIPWVWGPSGLPQLFPIPPTNPPAVVSSMTLPSGGNWLQMYYVCCQPSGHATFGNHAIHYYEYEAAARNNDRVGVHSNNAATTDLQFCNGKFLAAFTPIATTGFFQTLIQDEAPTPNGPSHFINAHMFAVKIDAGMFGAWTQPGATASNFYSRVFPYDSTELLLQTTPSYYYSNIAMGQVNTPQVPGTPPIAETGSTMLTIEGEPIGGPVVPIGPSKPSLANGGRVPMHRIGNHQHGGGRHYVSMRGGVFPSSTASVPPVPFDGDDAQIFIFNGLVNVIPPAPVADLPGPVTAFVPARESPSAVASLTALPYEPTWGRPVTSDRVDRELRIPTGYVISSPKFSRAVETVELSFTRDAATFATLLAFFEGLTASRTAFKWQPPWEMSAQPYAVLSMVLDEDNPSQRGIRSLRVSALKLVWVPP